MHLTGRLAEHADGRTFTGPTSGKFQQHLETGERRQLPSVTAVVQQLASSGNRDPAAAEDRD